MSVERIYQWAQTQPTRAALIYNDEAVDYSYFAKVIDNIRAGLEPQRPPAGSIAAVLVSHLADAWVIVLALQALGLTTIHIRSLSEAQELQLKTLSCVVTTTAEEGTHNFSGNVPAGIKVLVVPNLNQEAIRSNDLPRPMHTRRPYGGHILYTTGTTGHFKKVMWSGDLEEARSLARARIYGFTRDAMVHNLSFGLWTGTGFKTALSVWQAGGCLVLDQRPEKFRLFFRNKITFAKMTSAMLRELVTESDSRTECQIWIGGSAASAQLISQAISRFDNRIYLNYTSTELATYALSSQVLAAKDVLWMRPAADRKVQVVDHAGRECAPGEEGDFRVLITELDCGGYLDDAEATSKAFRDGFFYPGDRAVRDNSGRIRILGRTRDVLNIQGEKAPVGPIEHWIQEYLEVDEVCVFAGLNNAGEDEMAVAIQSDTRPSEAQLNAVRAEFASFQRVKFVVLKEFPRTGPGTREKVRREDLRKLMFS